MAVRIDLTLDCANPTRLAEFWKLALGSVDGLGVDPAEAGVVGGVYEALLVPQCIAAGQ